MLPSDGNQIKRAFDRQDYPDAVTDSHGNLCFSGTAASKRVKLAALEMSNSCTLNSSCGGQR